MNGAYSGLQKYLTARYAGTVVLTFGEIEDLIGFALPPAARELEWWALAAPGASASGQSQAWTLARRTATVNLRAETVSFERGSD